MLDHESIASPALHGGASETGVHGTEGSAASWRGSAGSKAGLAHEPAMGGAWIPETVSRAPRKTGTAPGRRSAAAALAPPSREEAEAAVRTLLRWAGDDPAREGLRDTPARVARAYEEFFAGYREDPAALLARTFEEVEGYDEMIVLRDIRFESHCEHHLVPIIGRAHVAYLPRRRVVGISKLARLVEVYAKRLQIQEKMTVQIADTLQSVLQPKGVAVVIEASHQCMTTRGVHKPGVAMVTSRLLGAFRDDPQTRREFFALIGGGGPAPLAA